MMDKLKVVFMGTPDIAVPCLEMLTTNEYVEIIDIVTMPDRKSGRGQKLNSPAVAIKAKELALPLFQTTSINKESEKLSEWSSKKVDLIIVFAFAQFLNEEILKVPIRGCFNIHTSLLPKYRGAAPIHYAILNGDKETGISIQKMVKKMDAGDIAHSKNVSIGPNQTGGELYDELMVLSPITLKEFLEKLINDSINYSKQDESKVSFAPTLKKEDGYLDFTKSSFAELKNRVRAFQPWPGTYCLFNGKRMKVFSIEKGPSNLKENETSIQFNSLEVGCKDSSVRLAEVQLEGRKRCSDIDLLNGLKSNNNISTYTIN